MKLHIDFPWGGAFEMERQPMELEKFYALCVVAGGALFVALLLGGTVLRREREGQMPRPRKTEAQKRADRFGELYLVGKARSGLTEAQCAVIAGVCQKSLFNARKDPNEKISIGQLARFGAAFGWSDEDYLSIIRPKK